MNDAFIVSGGKRLGNRCSEVQNSIDRETLFGDQPLKRLALDQLHSEEVDAVYFFERVNSYYVGMVERSEHARLALETSKPLGVAHESRRQNFDGYAATKLGVAAPIDIAHPSGA